MTEEEAQAWVRDTFGASSADKLLAFGGMVMAENARQNLIAPSTVTQLWTRHLTDSAQLMTFAQPKARTWFDVGTGAGFPGLVIACLFDGDVHLVEPRARRAAFLTDSARSLKLSNVVVHQSKVEVVRGQCADIISARAVATPEVLFGVTKQLANASTRYILPRGRSGADDAERLRSTCKGMFHVEHSLTDDTSSIIIADGVTR